MSPIERKPVIFGHRGSRRPGPENTPRAVAGALDAGADGVEIDVRRWGPDERLVLSHDPVSGGAEIGADCLDAVLDAARGRGRVICEVKNKPGEADFDAPACRTAHLLVSLLASRAGADDGALDDVVVSSFDWHTLSAVRALGGPPTAFLTQPGVALSAGISYASEHGHAEVHPHWTSVTAKGVARAHELGVRVVPWTATSTRRAQSLARIGVDGVICDDPAAVVAALA